MPPKRLDKVFDCISMAGCGYGNWAAQLRDIIHEESLSRLQQRPLTDFGDASVNNEKIL